MLTNTKAVIFDLDGTLVDSMYVWSKVDSNFLKIRGLEVPKNLIEEISHLSFIDTAKYFKNRFDLANTIEEIIEEWNSMAYSEYSNTVKLKAGAKEFLELLKSKSIKIGLATSNSEQLLELVLKNNGVYDYFDAITTTMEVERGKNHPDVYLLAAKKLGVNPSECIVFEDILPAVKGAKAANMTVVGIYDKHADYQKEDIIKTADHFIYTYTELIK